MRRLSWDFWGFSGYLLRIGFLVYLCRFKVVLCSVFVVCVWEVFMMFFFIGIVGLSREIARSGVVFEFLIWVF